MKLNSEYRKWSKTVFKKIILTVIIKKSSYILIKTQKQQQQNKLTPKFWRLQSVNAFWCLLHTDSTFKIRSNSRLPISILNAAVLHFVTMTTLAVWSDVWQHKNRQGVVVQFRTRWDDTGQQTKNMIITGIMLYLGPYQTLTMKQWAAACSLK